MTLIEYIAKEDDESIEWATKFLNGLFEGIKLNPVHFGDCTSEPNTCNLCLLSSLLDDYESKTRTKHP